MWPFVLADFTYYGFTSSFAKTPYNTLQICETDTIQGVGGSVIYAS